MRFQGISHVLLISAIAWAIPANAQSRGSGHKPPVETTMNLSYPANFYGTSLQTGIIGSFKLGAVYPNGMSYGCLIPETIGTTTYSNTSCVDTTGAPQDYETCVARCIDPATSQPVPVEPIYWQKNASNTWQAGYTSSGSTPLTVSYIDWGDNLEGKTWPAQALRVETNTFSEFPPFVDGTLLADDPAARFDVWHVNGQGTNELWGVHATSADPALPYLFFNADSNVYWPYAVNVSASARLNIAKLDGGPATCPVTGTGATQSPFRDANNLVWDPVGSIWRGAAYTMDILYGAELNIKGSYVFGYNWDLRKLSVPQDVNKAGWWRLTFYTRDHSIDFSTWKSPADAGVNTLAPPTVTATVGTLSAIEPAAETGLLLYVPQVDSVNQMTYLDICISASKGGKGGASRR